jgi:ubiquinone/menaquinone biosynthesis C-methylase UbiE
LRRDCQQLGKKKKMGDLYQRPEDYDLEHVGYTDDIEFYTSIVQKYRPLNLLELGCGTGRITHPLAEIGARDGFDVTGLDSQREMLQKALQRRREIPSKVQNRLNFVHGDMRTWRAEDRNFDLILIPCCSITHVLSLEDQIATWRQCYENLTTGGRFIVETNMPNMDIFADSFRVPPRTPIELDLDTFDQRDGTRLIRRKTTHYVSDEQCAEIRFLYEKYQHGRPIDNFIDDFKSHVFFPRELRLLFMLTGFEVEETFGDYQGRLLKSQSPMIIMVGRRKS